MIKLSRISWRNKKLSQKCINIVNNTYNNQKIHTYYGNTGCAVFIRGIAKLDRYVPKKEF